MSELAFHMYGETINTIANLTTLTHSLFKLHMHTHTHTYTQVHRAHAELHWSLVFSPLMCAVLHNRPKVELSGCLSANLLLTLQASHDHYLAWHIIFDTCTMCVIERHSHTQLMQTPHTHTHTPTAALHIVKCVASCIHVHVCWV